MGASIPDRATVAELAGVLQLSRTQLYKHIRKAQLEPDANRRYSTRALMDAILRHRADDNRLKGHGELKARKLQTEGEILVARQACILGPPERHLAQRRTHGAEPLRQRVVELRRGERRGRTALGAPHHEDAAVIEQRRRV